ncbi:MAG: hypothetical protein DMG43_10110 [Acidobacteria bacterium]|nr:MAG: hypothetical protein DMG43_10110 [Acidobacteriota bacterium]
MASGGKRGGAGERVLEGRHVIGLFMLMMLFSGVFFTLGYVMGRNQYDGQVRAATDLRGKPQPPISPKPDVVPKRTNNSAPTEPPTDTAAPPNSDWEFYHAGENSAHKSAPVLVRTPAPPKTFSGSSKSLNAPLIPGGAYTLQVAALTREADALELATRLQKRKFPAFVVSPQTDKYYRVQVGPYSDQKAAEAARKGLEGAGFKAIVKH